MTLRRDIIQRTVGGLINRNKERNTQVIVRGLDHINLTIEEGDRIGLIGHNGSGKTTMLKIISGIYEPTSGEVLVEGRLSPLFNLAPGWDPEDTGYENIVNCGTYLGMSEKEIEEKTPEIAEITGLGSYLDLPTRTYSAGMTLRLAFAIATSIEPEILVLDEGLSAGDLSFAEQAQSRIDQLLRRTRILVLASHSPEILKSWCNRSILLERGNIVFQGSVEETLEAYHKSVH